MVHSRGCICLFFYLCCSICLAQTSVDGSGKLSCDEAKEIIALAKNSFESIKGDRDTLIKADAHVFRSKKTFGITGSTTVFDDPDYNRAGLNFAVYQGKDKSIAAKVFEELMKVLDQCLLESGFEKVEGGIPDDGKLQPVTYFNKQITFEIAQRIQFGSSTPSLFLTVSYYPKQNPSNLKYRTKK